MWKPLGFYPVRQMARTALVWLTWSKFSHSLRPILLSVHYYLLSCSSLCTADPRAMLGLAPEWLATNSTSVTFPSCWHCYRPKFRIGCSYLQLIYYERDYTEQVYCTHAGNRRRFSNSSVRGRSNIFMWFWLCCLLKSDCSQTLDHIADRLNMLGPHSFKILLKTNR